MVARGTHWAVPSLIGKIHTWLSDRRTISGANIGHLRHKAGGGCGQNPWIAGLIFLALFSPQRPTSDTCA